jgi:hypothetical protein
MAGLTGVLLSIGQGDTAGNGRLRGAFISSQTIG